MSKKGNKTNEPKKTPIYRASEMLLRWALPIVDSLPKSLASQTLGGLMIRDLHDCLDAITIALSTSDRAQKIQCIKLLSVHLTSIETTMRFYRKPVCITKAGSRFFRPCKPYYRTGRSLAGKVGNRGGGRIVKSIHG